VCMYACNRPGGGGRLGDFSHVLLSQSCVMTSVDGRLTGSGRGV
jgi:hypothetical protein